jgi:hypothetical protein
MTDYCVYDTAASAVKAGIPVTLLPELTADAADKTETDLGMPSKFERAGIKVQKAPGF